MNDVFCWRIERVVIATHTPADADADPGLRDRLLTHKLLIIPQVDDPRIAHTGYMVERRGVWTIRIAESSSNLAGMSKGEQRSEASSLVVTTWHIRTARRRPYPLESH